MRSYSTPQSAINLEITKLAIIECVASAALYVAIGVYLGTFRYLAVAVLFAPLMLFRTKVSSDWAIKRFRQSLDSLESLPYPLMMLALFMFVPLIGGMIRVFATIYWVVRRPLQTLLDTPQNWLRQSFCTDLAHPPEIVPGEAVIDRLDYVPTFEYFLVGVRSTKGVGTAGFIVGSLPLLIFGWIPAIIYRVSFKATAVAYAPFVWVAHATLRNPLSVKMRLERITKGELEKVRRGLSWIIVTTLVAKIALIFNWIDNGYFESKFPSQRFVASFVIPGSWPWWQITLGTDALLTFFLLFFADAALSRLDGQQPWRDEVVLKTVSTVSFVRAALSIVTMSHFFYTALVAVAPNSVVRLLTS